MSVYHRHGACCDGTQLSPHLPTHLSLPLLRLRPDPMGRSSHDGRGYVIYADDASAQRALRTLDGRLFFGRQLKVARDGPPQGIGGGSGGLFMPPPPPSIPMPPPGLPPPQFMMMMAAAAAAAAGGGGGGSMGIGPGVGRGPIISTAITAPPPLPPPPPPPPTNLRAIVDMLPPAEAHAILSELRTLASREPDAARALLLQWPSLAQAVALLLSSGGALRTATPAYTSAAATAASRAPLSAEEQEQVSLVRSVLAMGDREVAALPWDRRQGVLQIRAAVMSPLEALQAGPPDQRKTLLDLREQLSALLQRATTVR